MRIWELPEGSRELTRQTKAQIENFYRVTNTFARRARYQIAAAYCEGILLGTFVRWYATANPELDWPAYVVAGAAGLAVIRVLFGVRSRWLDLMTRHEHALVVLQEPYESLLNSNPSVTGRTHE